MKQDALNEALRLAERYLRLTRRQLMNKHGSVGPVWHNAGEIVATPVPSELLDLLEVIEHNAETVVLPELRLGGFPRHYSFHLRIECIRIYI